MKNTTSQTKNQNEICEALFNAIQAEPTNSRSRRWAIDRYQKANAARAELKRAERLATK